MADAVFNCVCPPPEQLVRSTSEPVCPVDGCGKAFKHEGMLKMHLVMTHKIVADEKDRKLLLARSQLTRETSGEKVVETRYFCPVSVCPYFIGVGDDLGAGRKFFASFSLLRKHYHRMHEPRSHSCVDCGVSFARACDLSRHRKSCGVPGTCVFCGAAFANLAALDSHCRRLHAPLRTTFRGNGKIVHTIVQNALQFVSLIDEVGETIHDGKTKRFILPKPSLMMSPSTSPGTSSVSTSESREANHTPNQDEPHHPLPNVLSSSTNKSSAETQTSKDLTIEGTLRVEIPQPVDALFGLRRSASTAAAAPDRQSRGAQVSPRARRFCREEAASGTKEKKHNETQTRVAGKRGGGGRGGGEKRFKFSASRGTHADMRSCLGVAPSSARPPSTPATLCESTDVSTRSMLLEFDSIFESISTQTRESFLMDKKMAEASTTCCGLETEERLLVGRDVTLSPVDVKIDDPLKPFINKPVDASSSFNIETQTDISLAVLEGLWSLSGLCPPPAASPLRYPEDAAAAAAGDTLLASPADGVARAAPIFMTHIETQTLDSEPVGFVSGEDVNFFANTETQTTDDLFPDLVDYLADLDAMDEEDAEDCVEVLAPESTPSESSPTTASVAATLTPGGFLEGTHRRPRHRARHQQQQHQGVQTTSGEKGGGAKGGNEVGGLAENFSLTDSQTQTCFPMLDHVNLEGSILQL